MVLAVIWFAIIAFLLAGYAVLDGFDLGVGMLHPFARSDAERDLHVNAIAPVWDGNEVWLVTAGACLFAAFPRAYATVFSGFYLAMMALLLALVLRAVAIEFRHHHPHPRWRHGWDWAFAGGSFGASALFGIALGNVLAGLPIDRDGRYPGAFVGLLGPFPLVVGALTAALFALHGALYLRLKGEGELVERLGRWSRWLLAAVILLYAAATALAIAVAPHLFAEARGRPLFWFFVLVLAGSLAALAWAIRTGRARTAFGASSSVITAVTSLAAISLYPRLLPSSIDPAFSLTLHNSAASPRSLAAMLVVAAIGLPIVIGYTVVIYRVFRGKVTLVEHHY